MEIIKATKKDYKELLDLVALTEKEFFPPLSQRSGTVEKWFRWAFQKHSFWLMAKEKNKLIGAIAVDIGIAENKKMPGTACITFLATRPRFRRRGIAVALSKELEKRLKEKGVNTILTRTWSTNKAGINFYTKRAGFVVDRIIKDDRAPGVDTIWVKKKL